MENSIEVCEFRTITKIITAITTPGLYSHCYLSLFIKFLGLFLFFLSITSKIPQILSMIKKKTNKGLSLISLYADFISVLMQGIFSYNKKLPIYIYGEYLSVSLQNGILILLYWFYEDRDEMKLRKSLSVFISRIISSIILLTCVYVCLFHSKIVPAYIFQVMGLSNLPITTTSRISQILVLIYSKDVGCLSFSSNFMKFLKNCIKGTIILLDAYNPILFFNQVYNGFTVFIILVLIIILSKTHGDETKQKREKKSHNN